jgi:hypothetical protein
MQVFYYIVKIALPNPNNKLFISKESNTKKLEGVATLSPSFPPSGTWTFYFVNRPPTPNILDIGIGSEYSIFK